MLGLGVIHPQGDTRGPQRNPEEHNKDILGGGFKYVFFQPYLGKISNLTSIFQLGWNHRLILVGQRNDGHLQRWNFRVSSVPARTKARKVLCCRSDSDEGWLGFERWLKGISRHPKVLQSYLVFLGRCGQDPFKKKGFSSSGDGDFGVEKKKRSSRGIWIGYDLRKF